MYSLKPWERNDVSTTCDELTGELYDMVRGGHRCNLWPPDVHRSTVRRLAIKAARYGNVAVLNWLAADHHIKKHLWFVAVYHGQLSSVRFLFYREILPRNSVLGYRSKCREYLDWRTQFNITGWPELKSLAFRGGSVDLIRWLIDKSIITIQGDWDLYQSLLIGDIELTLYIAILLKYDEIVDVIKACRSRDRVTWQTLRHTIALSSRCLSVLMRYATRQMLDDLSAVRSETLLYYQGRHQFA